MRAYNCGAIIIVLYNKKDPDECEFRGFDDILK